MKRQIIYLMIGILLLSSVQGLTPMPVNGRLIGDNIANHIVKVTNLNRDESGTYVTTTSGEFLVETANFPSGMPGVNNQIEVKVLSCEGIPACTQVLVYKGEPNLYVEFDLSNIKVPCPSCPAAVAECKKCSSCHCPAPGAYECDECQPCEVECNNENTCPTDTTPYATCDSCCDVCEPVIVKEPCDCGPDKVCEVCEECPEIPLGLTGAQILIYIISLIGIGGLGTYIGTEISKDKITKIRNVTYRVKVQRDGDIIEEHRHPGIKSYHLINVLHRETHERHIKGEKFPLYEKDASGRYIYVRK